jgi:hypothetical protein
VLRLANETGKQDDDELESGQGPVASNERSREVDGRESLLRPQGGLACEAQAEGPLRGKATAIIGPAISRTRRTPRTACLGDVSAVFGCAVEVDHARAGARPHKAGALIAALK